MSHNAHDPAAQPPPPPPGYGPPAPVTSPPTAYGPPQPGYPVPQYAPRPRTGGTAWALGFIVFAPVPFLSALAAGIAMAIPYGSLRRQGALARENARAAANWGLTFTLVSTTLLVTHFVLLFTLTQDSPVKDFYPLGIPITLYAAVILAHIVITIVGTVRASQGRVTRVPSIPFIRR